MAKPTKIQATLTLVITVLTAVSGFLGYDKYEQVQAANAVPVEVAVKVEVPKGPDHAHGAVLSQIDIGVLISNAIATQHEKDRDLFVQKEAWQ